jgi:ABC-type hemin transport system ATPase subunit
MIEIASGICDVQHLMMRTMNTLSGGELQRVLLAGAVARILQYCFWMSQRHFWILPMKALF